MFLISMHMFCSRDPPKLDFGFPLGFPFKPAQEGNRASEKDEPISLHRSFRIWCRPPQEMDDLQAGLVRFETYITYTDM